MSLQQILIAFGSKTLSKHSIVLQHYRLQNENQELFSALLLSEVQLLDDAFGRACAIVNERNIYLQQAAAT